MSNSKQDQLINKIFTGLEELSERTTDPALAQLLLQTLLATNSLRQELERQAVSTPAAVEFDVDQAVVDAIAADTQRTEFRSLGYLLERYPSTAIIDDSGRLGVTQALDKYGKNYRVENWARIELGYLNL